jgi:pimeloyl-ACP methyl ester carboxylesterase
MTTTSTIPNRPEAESDARWQQLAVDLGVPPRPSPLRRWVQSPNGGHLSGLVWGAAKSEVVLVHDLGDSSNGWDAVAVSSGRDIVALDLAGHGRSSAAASVAPPARQAPALLDAIRSLAPTARLVVATGFGAVVALHAAIKRPTSIRALLVVDGGAVASGIHPLIDEAGLADVDDAVRRLTDVAPRRHPAFIRHLATETTTPAGNGRLEWRYQLGGVPAEAASWASIDPLSEVSIPVAVVTSASGIVVDSIVQSILRTWPGTQRLEIGGPPDDLIGGSPLGIASAIDSYLEQLEGATAS